mgnify:FL=1
MDLFDIVGPIMVGPSSSHTAGAVRMGYVAGKLLGEPIRKAEILLYGSFLATGEGHGTKKALVAGLLGMQPDDYQIADSFELAAQRGITVVFGEAHLEEAHPNTAVLRLTGVGKKYTEVQVSSIGGSRISIDKIDGINTGFSGECPTLIVHNMDQPGCIVAVTSMLAKKNVNIATMQVYRSAKGEQAVMVVECDQPVSEDGIQWLEQVEGVLKVTYFAGIGA